MQRKHRQKSPCRRRGSAAVELVMLIPLLALLLALLFTVGSAGVSSLNVTIRARNEGWVAARQSASSAPLNLRSASPDIATESTTLPLAYSLPRLSLGDANGQFSAMQGSWDHRELFQEEGVHWKEARRVAIAGVDPLSDLIDQFLSNENSIADILEEFGFEKASEAILGDIPIDVGDAMMDQAIQNALTNSTDMLKDAIEDVLKNLHKEILDITDKDKRKSLQKKIDRLNDALDAL